MTILEASALVLVLTALFGYLNERFLRLPTPIGVTLVALVASLVLILFGGEAQVAWSERFLESLAFDDLVMEGMLSYLLFAGSLHVQIEDLRRQRGAILLLATLGVTLSTFLVGTLAFLALQALGMGVPYLWALVFGALISPTDPIAVLGILRRLGVREDVETLVVGESLFNDGVGIVVFLALLGFATTTGGPGLEAAGEAHAGGAGGAALLFAQEALGGIALGLALGYAAYLMLRNIDAYSVEVLITLALVTGGYALALALHTSGPLAMVAAGLLIGNRGRALAMSERTREHLDAFWELLDEILNAVLFVLIGLEVLVLFEGFPWTAALVAVPLVLLGRTAAVALPIGLLRMRRAFPDWTIRTMVWGGLRGGISIALALSLPEGEERALILPMTYGVVVFSILVQGLTVGRVAGRIPPRDLDPAEAGAPRGPWTEGR